MEQPSLFGEHPTSVRSSRPSGPHQQLVDAWSTLWKETRGFLWDWCPKDLHFIRETLRLRAHGDPSLALEVMRRLLLTPPRPWYETEASPAILYSHWPALRAAAAARARPTGPGLVNQPRPRAADARTCAFCSYANPAGAERCRSCGRHLAT